MRLKEAEESEHVILLILRINTDWASYLWGEEKISLFVIKREGYFLDRLDGVRASKNANALHSETSRVLVVNGAVDSNGLLRELLVRVEARTTSNVIIFIKHFPQLGQPWLDTIFGLPIGVINLTSLINLGGSHCFHFLLDIDRNSLILGVVRITEPKNTELDICQKWGLFAIPTQKFDKFLAILGSVAIACGRGYYDAYMGE